jgi:hypothetical protein
MGGGRLLRASVRGKQRQENKLQIAHGKAIHEIRSCQK